MSQAVEIGTVGRSASEASERRRRSVKSVIRPFLPTWLIRWVTDNRAAVRLRAILKGWLHRHQKHDEVYGDDYYEMIDSTTGKSAGIMAQSIVEHLQPETVIDLGCGPGNLLEELEALHVSARGVEFAKAALAFCRERGLDVLSIDFTDPEALAEPLGRFDLAICTEVAIQLPPEAAKNLIHYLCRHADTVLFSSPPCARERLPKSPQTAQYWVGEFAGQNFSLDEELSKLFQIQWREKGTAAWFHREPMVFRRDDTA